MLTRLETLERTAAEEARRLKLQRDELAAEIRRLEHLARERDPSGRWEDIRTAKIDELKRDLAHLNNRLACT